MQSKYLAWYGPSLSSFFGTKSLPVIDVDFVNLESFLKTQKGVEDITGVQKKLSLNLSFGKPYNRLTLFNKPQGYIIKFEDNDSVMAINEFVTMSLANLLNIPTVQFGLIKLPNGQLAYITKRIDRIDDKKIHMEDFCQLANKPTEQKYTSSYEYCASILKKYSTISKYSTLELSTFFKVLLFSFISGNSDMHLKNFSLIEDEEIYLAPFYDLINVHLRINDIEDFALPLNGKKSKLTKNDFISFGIHIGLKETSIKKIFRQFVEKEEKMLELINDSLLSEDDKNKYINELVQKLKIFTI